MGDYPLVGRLRRGRQAWPYRHQDDATPHLRVPRSINKGQKMIELTATLPRVRRPLLRARLCDLTAKTLDKGAQAGITRHYAGQLLSILEGGPEIPSIAAEANERR